eukprot:CAMPEP_0182595618 /NCGR_PEP_ID=MMETSP1324-20130603/82627_1 /TAXON_ID=236786 /ORGANISM="Florenciella sp., Strain RCC1587" /LENGTH=45 /DNA_ID= /DNA_START= /DNA_END= /DNA_ORIENTATION=
MVSELSEQLATHGLSLDQIEQMEAVNSQMEKANSDLQAEVDSCTA